MSDKPPVSPLPPDAVRIDLPHRPQCLPDIYQVPGHTLEPDFGAFKGNTYMVIMDDTEDARKALKEYLDQAHIPQGTPGGIQNAGYFLLKPGDCLIARRKNWSGREEDDKVQVVVVPHECFSAASRSRFMQVRDTVLGPRGQWRPQKGGVFWEQSDEAKSLKNGHRAYLLALSDQKAKQLTSPMVCNKIKNGELTEHQRLRKELIQANAAIAVQAMELSVPREAKLLRQRAEACNFPQVGISGNFYFPAMQLNLAPAAQAEQATKTLHDSLGQFGGKHIDIYDSLNGWTHLLCNSDLVDDEDAGVFFIMTFGVCVDLSGFASVLFSGRHVHGGFPPTAKPGKQPSQDSYRVVVVSYPPSATLDVLDKFSLAHLPDGPLYLHREFIDPKHDNKVIMHNPTTMFTDGLAIMDEPGLMTYAGRAMASLVAGVMRQLPSSLDVKFDVNRFLGAITYLDPSTGERSTLTPWELGPGCTEASSLGCTRAEVPELWANHRESLRPFYPELDAKTKLLIAPQEDEMDMDPEGERMEEGMVSLLMQQAVGLTPLTEQPARGKRGRHEDERTSTGRLHKRTKPNPQDYADIHAAAQRKHAGRLEGLNLGASQFKVPTARKGRGTTSMGQRGVTGAGDEGADPATSGSTSSPMTLRSRPQPAIDDSGLNGGDDDGEEELVDDRSDPDYAPPVKQTRSLRRLVSPLPEEDLQEIWRAGGELVGECPSDSHSHQEGISPEPDSSAPGEDIQPAETSEAVSSKPYLHVLKAFDLSSLQAVLQLFQEEVERVKSNQALAERFTGQAYKDITKIMVDYDRPAMFSLGYVTSFPNFWKAVSIQELRAESYKLGVLAMRADIMGAVGAAWTWMDVRLPAMCKSILRGEVEEAQVPWLWSLVQDVASARRSSTSVELLPSKYSLYATHAKPHTIDFTLHDQPDQEDFENDVISQVYSMLRAWLAFPDSANSISHIQGTFIRHILSVFGTGHVLYLEKMWQFFTTARASLLGSTSRRRQAFHPGLLDAFLEDLKQHPLANPLSQERQVLSQLHFVVQQLHSILKGTPDAAVEQGASSATSHPRQLPSPSQSTSSGPPSLPPAPTTPSSPLALAQAQLLKFILELLPLVDPAGGMRTPPNPTPLQAWALQEPDFRFPFRQHAPEVVFARAPGSFLHPSHANEPGALASHWGWRGIFYRTQFSKDHSGQLFFPTLAAWEQKHAELLATGQLEPGYFCNKSAYGTYSEQRSESNMARYFELEQAWKTAFPSSQPVPYSEAFTWMNRHLPGIGKLTAALCASDMVYAGRVQMPSPEEMGTIVRRIDAGAKKALSNFGLVPGKKASMTVSAFCSLYQAVRDALTEEQRNLMIFDPIMFEHLLCKWTRGQDVPRT
ncbi:hypothetical protein OH77DRAFT_1322370 [Trametes cingulata]|nr:hypothetical protein OH77DRAFT_1322370 [Trametes cingulata]